MWVSTKNVVQLFWFFVRFKQSKYIFIHINGLRLSRFFTVISHISSYAEKLVNQVVYLLNKSKILVC